MSKHTPGPWHRNIAPATKYCTIFASRNEHIAAIHHKKDGEEAEANHNLICAAPDLLAALELIYSNAAESPEWIRSRIAPAIAKAKGE